MYDIVVALKKIKKKQRYITEKVKFTGMWMKPIQKSNVRKIKNISNTKKGKLDTDKIVEQIL